MNKVINQSCSEPFRRPDLAGMRNEEFETAMLQGNKHDALRGRIPAREEQDCVCLNDHLSQ